MLRSQTLLNIQSCVRGITMPQFRYPIAIDVRDDDAAGFSVVVFHLSTLVNARDGGGTIPLQSVESYPLEFFEGRGTRTDLNKAVVEQVRWLVSKFVQHEIDECLLVEGVRVFDPHKDEPPAKRVVVETHMYGQPPTADTHVRTYKCDTCGYELVIRYTAASGPPAPPDKGTKCGMPVKRKTGIGVFRCKGKYVHVSTTATAPLPPT